jgi:hypothetical protein
MMLWFEHGPDAAATGRSVEMINKYHAHFARSHPDGSADPEDYLYVICMNATLVHNAECLVGMPGFSPRQKRAMHRFWAGIADQFTTPDGWPVTSQVPFPEDFAAMERLVQDYQARPWPVHPPGHLSTSSAIESFTVWWFPRL